MLNGAKLPALHARIPETVPRPTKLPMLLGPSVVAPSWMSPVPDSEPARLAISLCMQCGNTVPAPTTNELPHALAPSAKFSCCWANEAYWLEPPYSWYSASVMNRPNACGEASEAPSWVPSANGSPLAQASPVRSWAARSASSVAGAITGLSPAPDACCPVACCRACSSSASATAPLS